MSKNSLGQDMVLFPRGKLLNVDEVALILNVSPSTIRGWVFEKKIPFVKFGIGKKSVVRFNPKVLNDWINENSKNPKTSDNQNADLKNHSGLKKASHGTVKKFESYLADLK